MIDLRLAQLRHFLLIVETKNFRAAAKLAFRSQPALSQSIRQLEFRLGQPLFEKTSRTTLTPFGESCLPLIQEMALHMERASASMLHMAQLSGGQLAFSILPSVASEWLPAVLNAFVIRHPGIEIKVLADGARKVQAMVSGSEVDFGISSLYEANPNIAFTPIIEDRFGLLCRNDHPLAKAGKSLGWQALRGQSILGNVMLTMLAGTPAWEYVANPRIHVGNLPTLIRLVEEGMGVTPVPALACPSDNRRLAFIPLVGPMRTRTIGIMTMVGRSLLPAAQAMVDMIGVELKRKVMAPVGALGRSRDLVKIVSV